MCNHVHTVLYEAPEREEFHVLLNARASLLGARMLLAKCKLVREIGLSTGGATCGRGFTAKAHYSTDGAVFHTSGVPKGPLLPRALFLCFSAKGSYAQRDCPWIAGLKAKANRQEQLGEALRSPSRCRSPGFGK